MHPSFLADGFPNLAEWSPIEWTTMLIWLAEIIAVTLVSAVIIHWFRATPVLKLVPAFVYVTGVSFAVSLLSVYVFRTLHDSPSVLLGYTVWGALASSGLYTWATGRAGQIHATRGPVRYYGTRAR